MRIFNFIFTFIFGINTVIWSSFSWAGTNYSFLEKTRKQQLEFYSQQKSAYSFKDQPKFQKTSVAELAKYSPKEMNRMIEALKSAKPFSTAISTTLRFPLEAFIFALAVGAVVTSELIVSYENNPMGLEQHIDHQLSPLGSFGFWSFMYVNGISHNMLRVLVRSQNFHRYITPYLGMTAGFFTQSFLSQIISNPKFQTCVESEARKNEEQKTIKNPCEEAYKEIVESELMYELAPGLISMLSSTALAAFVQYGAAKGINLLKESSAIVSTIFSLIPGEGWALSGAKFLLKQGAQIGLFYGFDTFLLNKMITTPWKNHFESKDISQLEDLISKRVTNLNNINWQNETEIKILDKNLKAFASEMSNWRQINTMEILSAHQGWLDKVNKLSIGYDVSYNFYSDLLNELQNTNNSRIFRQYPYFGVKSDGLNNEQLYFSRPDFVKAGQEDSIINLVNHINNNIKNKYYESLGFTQFEISAFKRVASLLSSSDIKVKMQGLQLVTYLNDTNSSTFEYYFPHQGFNYYVAETADMFSLKAKAKNVLKEVNKLKQIVGLPEPKLKIGEGYVFNYLKYSDNNETIKELEFPDTKGILRINNYVEYMIAQMICGPEIYQTDLSKNDKIISDSFGWSNQFIPPSITNTKASGKPQWLCKGPSLSPTNTIYETSIGKFKNSFEYIQNNLLPEITNADNFPDWWTSQTEPVLKTAFDKFEKEYYKLVDKMLKRIYNNEKSSWNLSNISNGPVLSIFQETQIYTKLLAEFYKVNYQKALNKPMPDHLLNSQLDKNKELIKVKASFTSSLPMHFEKKIEYEMALINWHIKSIKYFTDDSGKIFIQKGVELDAIKKNLDNIKNILETINKQMSSQVQFTPQQSEIIKTLNELILSSANQLAIYGEIASSMNWANLRKLSDEQSKMVEQFKKLIKGSLITAGKN